MLNPTNCGLDPVFMYIYIYNTYIYIYTYIYMCVSHSPAEHFAIPSPISPWLPTYVWAQVLHVGKVHDHIGCWPEQARRSLDYQWVEWERNLLRLNLETTCSYIFIIYFFLHLPYIKLEPWISQTSLNKYVSSSFSQNMNFEDMAEKCGSKNKMHFHVFCFKNRTDPYNKGSNMICKALYASGYTWNRNWVFCAGRGHHDCYQVTLVAQALM